eukprot:1743096-Amphidinium_carterae.2
MASKRSELGSGWGRVAVIQEYTRSLIIKFPRSINEFFRKRCGLEVHNRKQVGGISPEADCR